jgi:hypothetical protein
MVVRLADPADRRDLLELTQEGLRQLRRFRAMHDSAAVELFDVLSATERRQLVKLLRRRGQPKTRTPAGPPLCAPNWPIRSRLSGDLHAQTAAPSRQRS